LATRQASVSLDQLKRRAEAQPSAKNAVDVLRQDDAVTVIAEVKRSSPSKGAMAGIAEPAGLAADYEDGAASAISVLTEPRRFGGSLTDLADVRARVDVPVLRKDFIVSPYQVGEARAYGADLAVLIVAALGRTRRTALVERDEPLGARRLR